MLRSLAIPSILLCLNKLSQCSTSDGVFRQLVSVNFELNDVALISTMTGITVARCGAWCEVKYTGCIAYSFAPTSSRAQLGVCKIGRDPSAKRPMQGATIFYRTRGKKRKHQLWVSMSTMSDQLVNLEGSNFLRPYVSDPRRFKINRRLQLHLILGLWHHLQSSQRLLRENPAKPSFADKQRHQPEAGVQRDQLHLNALQQYFPQSVRWHSPLRQLLWQDVRHRTRWAEFGLQQRTS